MKLEVGDLVRRRRGKRKQEVGFVMEIWRHGTQVSTVTKLANKDGFVRVHWADGLKWNHLPNGLIKAE